MSHYNQCSECKVLIQQAHPEANIVGMSTINNTYICGRLVCDECAEKMTKTYGVKQGFEPRKAYK